MKKTKHLVVVAIAAIGLTLFISCGSSIESDAKKVAGLMCEAHKNPDKSISLAIQAEEITEKYTGDNKTKFEELAEKEYEECLKTVLKSSSNSEILNMDEDDEFEF